MSQTIIGVLTSGGDSPGMNAAIRAVVRTSYYHRIPVYGIRHGYQGLIDNDIIPLTPTSVSNIINRGGTILKTARCKQFHDPAGRKKAYDNLCLHGITGLIVIGGDGSFHGLHALIEEYPVKGLGLPGTIDNDLFGTEYTIGFDTAVNTALAAIDKIRDTATSHDRLFLIEVMGRHAGYIGLHTGIGGGAEGILIPETPTNITNLMQKLEEGAQRGKKSSIIVVAEGDEAGTVIDIKEHIERHTNWEVRISILGHQQRGGTPTGFDRLLASRLSYEAVLALLQGESDKMVGMINQTIVFTPLMDTWMKKKPIDPSNVTMADVLSS
jgi:6-phosphofructokinase 1